MGVPCAEVIGDPIIHALVWHLVYEPGETGLIQRVGARGCANRELMEL